jgi:hypothetical protein
MQIVNTDRHSGWPHILIRRTVFSSSHLWATPEIMPSTPHGVKSRPQVAGVMIGRMIRAFGADDVVGPRPEVQKTTFSDDC